MTICFLITNEYFNPRLREGGDSLHKLKKMMCRISIRASAKEATRENGRAEIFRNFNPRLREGGDADCSNSLASSSISIHASVKEATKAYPQIDKGIKISIHASVKEATATYCDTSAIMYISSLNNFFVRYF